MSANPFEKSRPAGVDLSRRQFMEKSGVALVAGVAMSSFSTVVDSSTEQGSGQPSKHPNIVILITDQERLPQYWPDGWADTNLPNRKRLAKHGLTFTNAFCNAAMCSPSRATLFTGLYPAQHGVEHVLNAANTEQPTLQPATQNMARMLVTAGYDVQYRGKWHMSKDPSGTLPVQSRSDLGRYGFQGWQPPDAGGDQNPATFGGGCTNYDAMYADQAAAFLERADPRASKPFALFVCLINPHDIMSYPSLWNQASFSDIPQFEGCNNYGDLAPGCFDQGISLPPTVHENTDKNFKPSAQAQSTAMWAQGLGPITSHQDQMKYVNFYAYLHRISDAHMGTVLDALESNHALYEKTIVIRLADHGEMGLSHGGMRQKAFNAYEETIHVPLVISNPMLFPNPVHTHALASLIDLMPTLATLADVPDRDRWNFKGVDLTPVIQDAIDHPGRHPTETVQDSILFTTDETDPGGTVTEPSHVRCLREMWWKFTIYFDPDGKADPQYELYDLRTDPTELHNMANPANVKYYDPDKTKVMLDKLLRKMEETGTDPRRFTGDSPDHHAEASPQIQDSTI